MIHKMMYARFEAAPGQVQPATGSWTVPAGVYAISAAVAVEVGKNRMEAIGEVQETADLIDWYADRMEEADGFDRPLADDPLPNFKSHNRCGRTASGR